MSVDGTHVIDAPLLRQEVRLVAPPPSKKLDGKQIVREFGRNNGGEATKHFRRVKARQGTPETHLNPIPAAYKNRFYVYFEQKRHFLLQPEDIVMVRRYGYHDVLPYGEMMSVSTPDSQLVPFSGDEIFSRTFERLMAQFAPKSHWQIRKNGQVYYENKGLSG